MIEKRAFLRVPFTALAVLTNNEQTFTGRLENISHGGVLVRLDRGAEPGINDTYTLLLDIEKYGMVLNVNVEVAYSSGSQVGLKFSRVDQGTGDEIAILISRIEKINYSLHSKQHAEQDALDDSSLTPP